ncbi:MAG: AAA family ATPase [Waddliaceae bacterium]
MPSYIERSIEKILRQAVSQFPAVILTGPRQAGKTTLLQQLLGSSHRYISLESPDVCAAATTDPRGFLDLNPAPVIFDEIQYAPDLLFYIKERIDEDRSNYGQYILTGSQNLLLQRRLRKLWQDEQLFCVCFPYH